MRSLNPRILRANDIRGTYGVDLNEKDAEAIGMAFGSMVIQARESKQVATVYDGRLSSPSLEAALVEGLLQSGVEVLRLGLGPTPLLYFAAATRSLGGGISVTGSHNPPEMNGMKFVLGAKPFFGEKIRDLAAIAERPAPIAHRGHLRSLDLIDHYVDRLAADFSGTRPIAIAWDPGNGATGDITKKLIQRLPGRHILINAEIDGRFPNHHPDPTNPENLTQLLTAVREYDCEVGLAFDGDGDRIGIIAPSGSILWGDQMLALFAEEILQRHPGATVIADVKASETLFDRVHQLGGRPVMWKTGHAFIKTKMAECGALLAGEMSGHIFFADRYYGYDDALYAAVRFLSLLAKNAEGFSSLQRRLPPIIATPELRFFCPDEDKFSAIERLQEKLAFQGANVSTIDGLRVNTEDGWWLLRASNTQAVLVGRCEGKDEMALARLRRELAAALSYVGVNNQCVE